MAWQRTWGSPERAYLGGFVDGFSCGFRLGYQYGYVDGYRHGSEDSLRFERDAIPDLTLVNGKTRGEIEFWKRREKEDERPNLQRLYEETMAKNSR
jgi:hypothetical protein